VTTLTPSEPTPTEPTRSEAQPSDSEPQPSGAPSSNVLEPRRLILSTVLVSMLLVGGVAALGTWFHRPLLAIADSFVGSLGGPGVALGYFIPDAFTIPLPNDVSSLLGLAGGMTFFEVCAWATLGSLLGGAVGYWVGRLLRTTRWLGRVFERRGGLAQQL
jgi:hypothetical protein